MKNKCFCLTFSTFWGLPQQPFYYVRICNYAKLKFREADKCDITVLLYRKPLIFGFKWGTKGTFSPCAKSRNTICSPLCVWCASELRLRSLFFVEVGAAIIVESTIVPFFRISPFAVSCSTTCEKSFSCSSLFEMAVLFFYTASACRLLIITIFLPSLQYLFSVFCRRKSGHLPELPWEEFFIIVTAAYWCRIDAHGGRIQ